MGVGLGLLLGWLTKLALSALHQATAETTVTVAAPFVAYLSAERLGGSGVLAVLALGLYLRHRGHFATTASGWVLGRSVWEYADYLISSLVFVLLGFELTIVIEHTATDPSTLRLAALVLATVVVFRPLWPSRRPRARGASGGAMRLCSPGSDVCWRRSSFKG